EGLRYIGGRVAAIRASRCDGTIRPSAPILHSNQPRRPCADDRAADRRGTRTLPPRARDTEIGRASCRERVKMAGGGARIKKTAPYTRCGKQDTHRSTGERRLEEREPQMRSNR